MVPVYVWSRLNCSKPTRFSSASADPVRCFFGGLVGRRLAARKGGLSLFEVGRVRARGDAVVRVEDAEVKLFGDMIMKADADVLTLLGARVGGFAESSEPQAACERGHLVVELREEVSGTRWSQRRGRRQAEGEPACSE